MKYAALFVLFALLLGSCAETDSPDSPQRDDRVARLKSMISQFGRKVSGSRSYDSDPMWIRAVQEKHYRIQGGRVVSEGEASLSRSEDEFSLSTVEFMKGGKNGVAVVSLDSRLSSVLYYTDNGELSDTVFNVAFGETLRDIPQIYANYMGVGDSLWINPDSIIIGPGGGEDPVLLYVPPIVKTKWGQGFPYNLQAPECHCSSCDPRLSGHQPIGCVTTALAQAIAKCGGYLPSFPHIQIDWTQIANHPTPTPTEYSFIGSFFGELATELGINFGCSGSSGHISRAATLLTNHGYTVEYTAGDIDFDKTFNSLRLGYPVLRAGHTNSEGHMWVVDGVWLVSVTNGLVLYSCNWGWTGFDDGWSVGNPYTGHESGDQYPYLGKQIYINAVP